MTPCNGQAEGKVPHPWSSPYPGAGSPGLCPGSFTFPMAWRGGQSCAHLTQVQSAGTRGSFIPCFKPPLSAPTWKIHLGATVRGYFVPSSLPALAFFKAFVLKDPPAALPSKPGGVVNHCCLRNWKELGPSHRTELVSVIQF